MQHRLAVILPTYLLMYVCCYRVGYLVRFDFSVPAEWEASFHLTLPFVLCLRFLACLAVGEWRRTYCYATLHDVLYTTAGISAVTAIVYAANAAGVFQALGGIPRSVILIDWAAALLGAVVLRTGIRVCRETASVLFGTAPGVRALVYGTGRDGIEILRAVRAADGDYRVVGLVGQSPGNHRMLIAGVPVLSEESGWRKLARSFKAEHVLIPGSVTGKRMREIVKQCSAAGLQTHVIPAVHEIVGGRYRLKTRNVTISDLLRREPSPLDLESIRGYIADRRVLVTGAAGSIGSELCRQILQLKPRSLVLLDQSEYGIFTMGQELLEPTDRESVLRFVVADVVNERSMLQVFEEHRPQIVFHAAAYKHVPLMEENVREALRNNVLGTRNVLDAAVRMESERFVLISTDKAVRPTNVMGATKLLAEKYVQAMAARPAPACITVRFGNVLDSAGSVVPTFRRQIERGGLVTVTHPKVERYFMTIPEAVELVLQAGALGGPGDVMGLDMGEPAKILDLALDMITLSGLRHPDDVEIVFTGLRPGEKMSEELFDQACECAHKVHEKIFCARSQPPSLVRLQRDLARLQAACAGSEDQARAALWEVVASCTATGGAPPKRLMPAA